MRASLQACFACECSNLRKHSLFLLFSPLFPLLFLFTFANLIIMMIIIGTIRGPCMFFPPFCFVSLLTQQTHVWFVCLFTHSLHKVGQVRYLHIYISLSSSPSLLCFAFISYEIEPNSPSARPSVRLSAFYISIFLPIFLMQLREKPSKSQARRQAGDF